MVKQSQHRKIGVNKSQLQRKKETKIDIPLST